MTRLFLAALMTVVLSGGMASANAGDAAEYQRILDTKCSQCHPRGPIEQALARGDDYNAVIEKMIRLGAQLTPREQQVLSVFWRRDQPQAPRKEPAAAAVTADPLGNFRLVLESRCTGCHSLDRVEEAMAQGRPLEDLIEMMRKRGAIVTEADKKALDPFWGSPYKQQ